MSKISTREWEDDRREEEEEVEKKNLHDKVHYYYSHDIFEMSVSHSGSTSRIFFLCFPVRSFSYNKHFSVLRILHEMMAGIYISAIHTNNV